MSLASFPHGVHPPEEKEVSNSRPIRRLPFPPYLVMLLAQHAGRPAKSIVREGQEVLRGELIAEADGFVSAPIHSPAAGIVKALTRALDFNGKMAEAIIIEPHPGSAQEVEIEAPIDTEPLSAEAIIAAVRNMGMVGLGGAAFPTHVKLSPPKGRKIDTLIINGCECEPYLTSDHRVMLEKADFVVKGARLLARALRAERIIIAVESNKPDAARELERAAGDTPVEVSVLETKYPQGAEKMLTLALLGREIPSGGLPADAGVLVSNIATAAEMGELLPRGRGLIERVVTVTGRGVRRPGNYVIPIGTPLDFILETAGFDRNACQVLFGGPMMGKSVSYLETPTTKGLTGIVVMAREETVEEGKTYPCIRCAQCLSACPMQLNPSRLGLLARRREFERMKNEYHLLDCFECGCCSYVCPSRIPLVQMFRLGKGALRKRKPA